LKLDYYKQEGWEKRWIDAAYKTILDAYNASYAPSQEEAATGEEEGNDEYDIFAHIYKRRRVERENELERYLAAECAESNIDLLAWWKVRNFSIFH
jgi:hypothetical protein